eukprot:TRINITY_DN5885_c0_g8_i1.p1 TRINITY_DN5885_c0_g8~~TRINITY_DN5885_c0_g8_i1.p1  ORF type:complete len:196 (-),score=48.53 TRINITY_DN5885_c0_g8_i1:922-1509(-)
MSSTEERAVKQTYLREVILEAGYNPDKFIRHLNSAKQDGDNIDNWALDELKLEVQKYKRYYSNEESSIAFPEQHREPPSTANFKGIKGRTEREFDGEIAEERKPEEIPINDKYLEEAKRHTLNTRRQCTAGHKEMSTSEDWPSKNGSVRSYTRQASYKTPCKGSSDNNCARHVWIFAICVVGDAKWEGEIGEKRE